MPYKILIVDDIEANSILLSVVLKKANNDYSIIFAKNWLEAINISKQELPNLILMDCKMPIMDGIEATKKIKQNKKTSSIPIILITAFVSNNNLQNAFKAGANDYISKPINDKELLARVKSLLNYQDLLSEVNKQKKELETINENLTQEQEKSETLLNSLFPKEVAWQLKSKGKVKPRHYKRVTVLFTDFKGFSRSCEYLDPIDIVNILDSYFIKFDEITEKHFIEKIKTIGDSYMCVGGLPLRNHSHPYNVVLAALEIQKFMNDLNDQKVLEKLPVWELRVGIHTGDVIAGVVGKTKYAYDIWGANVNIASRMEQNGAVGMVNISGSTYEEIKDYFDCVYRGKIEAKNIGKIDMYFVEGLKQEFASDNSRCLPNENFIKILNSI